MSTYDTEQLDQLEPTYLANYGLNQAPFSSLHEDRFLYLDAERAQRLNLLQHMTQYSNLLLIVQGEHGVGKTSLLTRFIKNSMANWRICDVTANTMMDAGQLLFQVAQGFGLEQLPQDSSELQDLLYARVATYHRDGEIPILLIDDAHELPRDALLAIFNLADARVENANLLRIILFAEPQIEKILNTKDVRALRERITHTMIIPPLDEEATAEYLKHRMAVAGFNGGSPFTPKMIKRIYKASGGYPARINQLAHETLDKGDFEKEELENNPLPVQSKRRTIPKVWVSLGVILLVVMLVFLFRINRIFEATSPQSKTIPLAEQPALQPEQTSPSTTEPQPAPAAASTTQSDRPELQEKIIPLKPPPDTIATETTSPPPAPGSETVPAEQPSTQSPQAMVSSPPASATQTTTPTETAGKEPLLQLDNVEPDPVPASTTSQTITLNGQGFRDESKVFVSWGDKTKQIPVERVKRLNDTRIQVRLTVGTGQDKWQVWVVDPERGKSNLLGFQIAAAPGKGTPNDWVLARAPEQFTLQLFGSYEKQNAKAFIQEHQLGQQAHYFIGEHKGRRWYSVVYGVYPDQAAAAAAGKVLPASLKHIKPWVRRFDDIQAGINASRKLAQNTPTTQTALVNPAAVPSKAGDAKQYESWLWSQDPRYFTLQLLGAREMDSVKKFLRKYSSLTGKPVYFHTRHDARDWYAVVYGVYPDKQKAKAAIRRLPPELQKASPWIRSFASIHAELGRADH